MLSPPEVDGAYPVTALMEALGDQCTVVVLDAPVAATVTTVAHAAEPIAAVPRAAVPDTLSEQLPPRVQVTPSIVMMSEMYVIADQPDTGAAIATT
jgi:hypothetical protein